MFEKKLSFGSTKIYIRITEKPYHEDEGRYLFGFPLIVNWNDVKLENIEDKISIIKGYFLFIGYSAESLVIASDITGGFRLYRYEYDHDVYFSDSYDYLLSIMMEKGPTGIDKYEYNFWKKHRYTTGGRTFINALDKVKPATIVKITADSVTEKIWFPDVYSEPDSKTHIKLCENDLSDTLALLKKVPNRKLLFFSGGADSTLLAQQMKKRGINFTPLFIKSSPFFQENYLDYQRAKAVSSMFGLPLEEVEVDVIQNLAEVKKVVKRLLFDRHLALLHFLSMNKVKEIYGPDVVIVNGQSSDSIFSFGPSQKTRGDYVRRVLMYKYKSLLARTFLRPLIRKRLGANYYLPTNLREFTLAFFDEYKYFTVLSKREQVEYYDYLNEIIRSIEEKFKSASALVMYLKIYGFLQGSDNQVVIQSAREAGIPRVLMPYNTPGMILATARYKNEIKEIFSPKYVINGKIMPELTVSKTIKNKKYDSCEEIEKLVMKKFFDEANVRYGVK